MTEPSFTFTIPNDKKRLYDRFALLIFLLNGIGILIRFFFRQKNDPVNAVQLALFAVPLLLIILVFVVSYGKSISSHLKIFLLGTLTICLFWLFKEPWWVALLTLLLALLYLLAQRELQITVSHAQITYPSLPRRRIAWEELNNLVFKDGLLTIDFKNDQLIQHYPENKINLPDEKEFNEFCRNRIGY